MTPSPFDADVISGGSLTWKMSPLTSRTMLRTLSGNQESAKTTTIETSSACVLACRFIFSCSLVFCARSVSSSCRCAGAVDAASAAASPGKAFPAAAPLTENVRSSRFLFALEKSPSGGADIGESPLEEGGGGADTTMLILASFAVWTPLFLFLSFGAGLWFAGFEMRLWSSVAEAASLTAAGAF